MSQGLGWWYWWWWWWDGTLSELLVRRPAMAPCFLAALVVCVRSALFVCLSFPARIYCFYCTVLAFQVFGGLFYVLLLLLRAAARREGRESKQKKGPSRAFLCRVGIGVSYVSVCVYGMHVPVNGIGEDR